jgi:hypothetical protein
MPLLINELSHSVLNLKKLLVGQNHAGFLAKRRGVEFFHGRQRIRIGSG